MVFGNVWRALNPWLAFADGVAWALAPARPGLDAAARLPAAARRLARRASLSPCFAALELIYAEPASPRALALAIALYSYAMWFGMAAFGREDVG